MKVKKIIPYLILLLTIPTIIQWLNVDTDNMTVIWWMINLAICITFYKSKRIYYANQKLPLPIHVFLFLVVCEFIYGLFLSRGYWDYKNLVGNIFIYLLPISIYVFSNPNLLSSTIRIWFKFGLILFFIFLPFMQAEAIGKYMIPVMFMSLFIKPLTNRKKIMILLLFSFVFIFGSLGARASVLKYSIALIFGLSMYTNFYRSKFLVGISYYIILIIPIVFLLFGFSGTFNVFKIDEYWSDGNDIRVTNSYDSKETESLSSDTRTFIYVEAINSAISQNYLLFGNSLARGYKSVSFAETDFYKEGERAASEVGIINIFTNFGLLGVIVYFWIFASASYRAVFKSNNIYMKMIGIYLTTRWVFSWIEEFSRFDLNYLFIWIIIGMCFSKNYRTMTTKEFEFWIKNIFYNYRKSFTYSKY